MTNISGSAPVRAAAQVDTPTGDDVPLEPKDALPTVAPYKASVGGWIGTGVGALAGGAVGAAIGGFIGLGAAANGGGGNIGGAIAIGVGLLGLVGGGIGVYQMNKGSYENRENSKLQADHGTATLQFARSMMQPYDHDGSGSIELVNSTGLESQDERVFTEERRQSQSHPKYDWFNDEWRTETERWTETRGTSAARVWNAADVDPKDQVISDVELARLMSKFDTNASGSLTTPEQEAFKAAHPVLVDGWQR